MARVHRPAWGSSAIAASAALALCICLAIAAPAHAAFTVSAPPVDAGLVSVSDISLNGTVGNTIVVEPGADVTITATVTNNDSGCGGCIDYTNVAFKSQPGAGCIGDFTQYQSTTYKVQSGSVDLGPAPIAPGTYDVIADTEQQFSCGTAFGASAQTVVAQVQVAVPGVTPTPKPPVIQPPAPATCGAHTVNLLAVYRLGNRAVVSGSARAALHGRSVKITPLIGARRAGPSTLVTIQGDGSFSTAVTLPSSRAKRAKLRYRAALAGVRSNALRLARQITILARTETPAGVVISAKLSATTKATRVTVSLLLDCAKSHKLTSVRTNSHGRFTITLPRPAAPAVIAYYRLSARRALGETFSLPIAIARLLG